MKIIVGTRGSKLALAQAKQVVDVLKINNPHIVFEMKIIKTKGDIIQDVALDQIGDKALFVKEIETELLEGSIDMAVHSMKDMPSYLPEGLCFSPTPKREDARDVLILKDGYNTLEDLPQGAVIATGSKRRAYQLLRLRPDLKIAPIRGNVDTRIQKIKTENLHGIILAAAGLHRLGLEAHISCYLPIELMLPAPGQGALAIEIRKKDKAVGQLLKVLYDETSDYTVQAERGFMDQIQGNCHMPMGAYAEMQSEQLTITGLYGDETGQKLLKRSLCGPKTEARALGIALAKGLLEELKLGK